MRVVLLGLLYVAAACNRSPAHETNASVASSAPSSGAAVSSGTTAVVLTQGGEYTVPIRNAQSVTLAPAGRIDLVAADDGTLHLVGKGVGNTLLTVLENGTQHVFDITVQAATPQLPVLGPTPSVVQPSPAVGHRAALAREAMKNGDYALARTLLEPALRGPGTVEEWTILRSICKQQRDVVCVDAIDARLKPVQRSKTPVPTSSGVNQDDFDDRR